MGTATETQNDEVTARQLLLSLRLLDGRLQRLGLKHDAEKKKWRDELSVATKHLNEQINDTAPVDDADCRKRLTTIQRAFETRKGLEDDKATALDKIKADVKSVEASIVECIRSEPTDQQALEFDAETGPGMNLTGETAREVAASMDDALEAGASKTTDMDELRERLGALGAKALHVVPGVDTGEEPANEPDEPEEDPKATPPELQSADDWDKSLKDRNLKALKPGYMVRVLGTNGEPAWDGHVIGSAMRDGEVVVSVWDPEDEHAFDIEPQLLQFKPE